jgi:SAM-dependent methyltransferase
MEDDDAVYLGPRGRRSDRAPQTASKPKEAPVQPEAPCDCPRCMRAAKQRATEPDALDRRSKASTKSTRAQPDRPYSDRVAADGARASDKKAKLRDSLHHDGDDNSKSAIEPRRTHHQQQQVRRRRARELDCSDDSESDDQERPRRPPTRPTQRKNGDTRSGGTQGRSPVRADKDGASRESRHRREPEPSAKTSLTGKVDARKAATHDVGRSRVIDVPERDAVGIASRRTDDVERARRPRTEERAPHARADDRDEHRHRHAKSHEQPDAPAGSLERDRWERNSTKNAVAHPPGLSHAKPTKRVRDVGTDVKGARSVAESRPRAAQPSREKVAQDAHLGAPTVARSTHALPTHKSQKDEVQVRASKEASRTVASTAVSFGTPAVRQAPASGAVTSSKTAAAPVPTQPRAAQTHEGGTSVLELGRGGAPPRKSIVPASQPRDNGADDRASLALNGTPQARERSLARHRTVGVEDGQNTARSDEPAPNVRHSERNPKTRPAADASHGQAADDRTTLSTTQKQPRTGDRKPAPRVRNGETQIEGPRYYQHPNHAANADNKREQHDPRAYERQSAPPPPPPSSSSLSSPSSRHKQPTARHPRSVSRIVWSLGVECSSAPALGCNPHERRRPSGEGYASSGGSDDASDRADAVIACLPHEVAYVRAVYNGVAARAVRTPVPGSPAITSAGAQSSGGSGSERMRAANNLLKSLLFGRYVPRRRDVMDLGCGRGQDVAKIEYTKPRSVIFVDVAERCLREAERRWSRAGAATFAAAFVHADFCSPAFLANLAIACHPHSGVAASPLGAPRSPLLSPDSPSFSSPGGVSDSLAAAATNVGPLVLDTGDQARGIVDAVSCQFAAHHAFYSADSAERFIANVSRVLRHGGVFLGTAPAGETVQQLLGALPPGARHQCGPLSLWRDQRDAGALGFGVAGGSGLAYQFHLGGQTAPSSDAEPIDAGYREYTMSTVDLTVACARHGLRRIMCAPMGALYCEESINPKNEELSRRMGLLIDPPNEHDIVNMNLYVAFVFVKTGPDATLAPSRQPQPQPPPLAEHKRSHNSPARPASSSSPLAGIAGNGPSVGAASNGQSSNAQTRASAVSQLQPRQQQQKCEHQAEAAACDLAKAQRSIDQRTLLAPRARLVSSTGSHETERPRARSPAVPRPGKTEVAAAPSEAADGAKRSTLKHHTRPNDGLRLGERAAAPEHRDSVNKRDTKGIDPGVGTVPAALLAEVEDIARETDSIVNGAENIMERITAMVEDAVRSMLAANSDHIGRGTGSDNSDESDGSASGDSDSDGDDARDANIPSSPTTAAAEPSPSVPSPSAGGMDARPVVFTAGSDCRDAAATTGDATQTEQSDSFTSTLGGQAAPPATAICDDGAISLHDSVEQEAHTETPPLAAPDTPIASPKGH